MPNKFAEQTYNTFTVPCEKSRTVSLTSSITKNIVVFPVMKNTVIFLGESKFPVKLVCCIAFGSASTASCLLKIYCNQLVAFFEAKMIM